jgi:hypothetical protein
MEVKLIELLESLGYPAFKQGSLPLEEYPESFFTYWNSDTEVKSYDNNTVTLIIWNYWVNFYSTKPELILPTIQMARAKLMASKFIVGGLGQDLACDRPEWSGRTIDVNYIQNYNEVI